MKTPSSTKPTTNSLIRHTIKQARKQLPLDDFTQHNEAICHRLIGFEALQKAEHIALYSALNGEVDLSKIQQWLYTQDNKRAYLPVTHTNGTLSFAQITPTSGYTKNRYGILEPDEHCARIKAQQLDVVLVPLVAFNPSKKRLGMGGGFYDRTFAFKKAESTRPILIGCAHSLQENLNFTSEDWDVDVDYIVTEKTLF